MRSKTFFRSIKLRPLDPAMVRTLLLAVFFLLGAAVGRWYSGSLDDDVRSAMETYLQDLCVVYRDGGGSLALGRCVALYFGGAILTFLLGFASVGVALIPALAAMTGFFSMYTVSAFVSCFGRPGAMLAVGALLVRMLFTLPCFFALAEAAWPLSTELFLLTCGQAKRSAPVLYGSRYFLLFVLCLLVLAAGVCCERLITPVLFRAALEGMAS